MRTTLRSLTTAVVAAIVMLGLAQTASAVVATGGNATNDVNGYRIHVFTNSATSGNFDVTVGGNVEVLVVAGGGGGGNAMSGGGGAGGFVYTNSYAVYVGTTNLSVGGGGPGGGTAAGSGGGNGTNSTFGIMTAIGGGGGGGWNGVSPKSGGSGGGGIAGGTTGALAAATSPSQGNNGGPGGTGGGYYAGGGGGGATSVGGTGVSNTGAGNGGTGTNLPQFAGIAGDTNYPAAAWFAGGGGGGTMVGGTKGTGGKGGGGNGGIVSGASNPGSPGQPNTGGGGGAGYFGTAYGGGGKGGSGIVLVRYTEVPIIQNLPATNVTAGSAWLNGYLVSTGADATAVAVYMGTTDGGDPTSGLWSVTNTLTGGPWSPGTSLTYQALGLIENATYYYRYYATNTFYPGWAATTEHFLAGNITVTNTDPLATRTPFGAPDTGMFTIERDPSATNDSLTVYYRWDGTAAVDVDFTPSPAGTSVTLPPGVASTNITITAVWNPAGAQGVSTVWLTLLPGEYGVGSPMSNYVTIADYAYTPDANVTTNAGNWNGAIWSLGRRPLPGDDVTVKHAVTLSNSTDYLNTFTITNSILTFKNWNTVLRATNVTLLNQGQMKITAWSTDGVQSNNIYISCGSLSISNGGAIDATASGWPGVLGGAGLGPGGGSGDFGAGTYGGKGYNNAKIPYGDVAMPLDPGSAGGSGSSSRTGGAGGGAIRIEATGGVLVNGTITADGGTSGADHSTCGSGGGIYINCDTIQGSGLVSATAAGSGGTYATSGGGGRVAVIYNTAHQANVQPVPSLLFKVGAVVSQDQGTLDGEPGTLYFPDNYFLVSPFRHSAQWAVTNFTSWSIDSLLITNGCLWVPTNGFALTVAHDLTIAGTNEHINQLRLVGGVVRAGGNLSMSKSRLWLLKGTSFGADVAVASNFVMGAGSTLYAYSAATNGTPDYGAHLSVTGQLSIASGATMYLYCDSITGGGPLIEAQSVSIVSGGMVDAAGGGYGTTGLDGRGPGGGSSSHGRSGGGYGGQGGNATSYGGGTYGSETAPINAGSGGSAYSGSGGAGGGVVRINAVGTLTVNGTIKADGATPGANNSGGAGGSIWLQCRTFAGSGTLSAIGGNGVASYGCGGGGGRIAIWRRIDASVNITTNLAGGNGASSPNGGAGSLYVYQIPSPGTIMTIR